MADIKQFPGTAKVEEDISVEEIVKKTLEEHKLKIIVMIGILEGGDEIVISGNSTISQGVYLMEAGKQILINGG